MNQLTNKLLAAAQFQESDGGSNTVRNKLTGLGIQPDANPTGQLEKILSAVIGVMTVFGVIFFTIQIILAGFSMMTSQGDPKELETGKKRLTNNVLGLAIIVLAYGLGALITNLLGIKDIFNLQNIFKPIGSN